MSRPAGRRPTFFIEEKSTFIIIGVIISQISTANGSIDLAAFTELNPSQSSRKAGKQFSEKDAGCHTERHPQR